MSLRIVCIALAALATSAGGARAQAAACQASATGPDWRAQLTVAFDAAGAARLSGLRVEVRGEAQDLTEESAWGWNVDMAKADPLIGWISVIRQGPAGQPPRAQVDVAAPQMFNLDDIMLGKGDGAVDVSLRIVADGAAVITRPAPLAGPGGPWPTSAANLQRFRVGDARAAAPEAEAVTLAGRLAKARKVRVEVVDGGGRAAGLMTLRDGVLPEAFAAEAGLRAKAAADLAAGRCRKA